MPSNEKKRKSKSSSNANGSAAENVIENHTAKKMMDLKSKTKYQSQHRHAAMQCHSGVATNFIEAVLPFNQAYVLRNIPSKLLMCLHDALYTVNGGDNVPQEDTWLKIFRSQEEYRNHKDGTDLEDTMLFTHSKNMMFHWYTNDGYRVVSMEEALQEKLTIEKSTYFDRSLLLQMEDFGEYLKWHLREVFHKKELDLQILFGMIKTGTCDHQQLHYDSCNAAKFASQLYKEGKLVEQSWRVGYSIFVPLWFEGSALRIMHHTQQSKNFDPLNTSEMKIGSYRINFGECLLLRNDIIHSGTYGSEGNIRLYGGIFPSVLDKGNTCENLQFYSKDPKINKNDENKVSIYDSLYDVQDLLADGNEEDDEITKKHNKRHRYGNEFRQNLTAHNSRYQRIANKVVGLANRQQTNKSRRSTSARKNVAAPNESGNNNSAAS
jgi:hypothetical protein